MIGAGILALSLMATPTEPAPVRLGMGVGTEFPISVGASVLGELPGRLQLSTSLGYLPRPYLEILNDVLVGLDAYDRNTATLIEEALESALVWRSHLGWRPVAGSGFYLAGGYSLITLGGGATDAQIIAGAIGAPPPGDAGLLDFDVDSTLHQASAELGWQWRLGTFALEAGVGGFYTFAASTRVAPAQGGDVAEVLLTPFTAAAESFLDDTYRDHVHGGFVTVTLYYDLL